MGRELFDKKEQTVERLMITIDNYMKKRNRDHHGLLRVWSSDDPHPQEEVSFRSGFVVIATGVIIIHIEAQLMQLTW